MNSRTVSLDHVPPVWRGRTPGRLPVRRGINVDAAGLSFGQRVGARRQSAGLTQAALADLAGLSVDRLHLLEQGRGEPMAHTLGLLARALGCSLDALWFGEAGS